VIHQTYIELLLELGVQVEEQHHQTQKDVLALFTVPHIRSLSHLIHLGERRKPEHNDCTLHRKCKIIHSLILAYMKCFDFNILDLIDSSSMRDYATKFFFWDKLTVYLKYEHASRSDDQMAESKSIILFH
jgi:hypothetical protein